MHQHLRGRSTLSRGALTSIARRWQYSSRADQHMMLCCVAVVIDCQAPMTCCNLPGAATRAIRCSGLQHISLQACQTLCGIGPDSHT